MNDDLYFKYLDEEILNPTMESLLRREIGYPIELKYFRHRACILWRCSCGTKIGTVIRDADRIESWTNRLRSMIEEHMEECK